MQRYQFYFFTLCLLAGCSPAPQVINRSQNANAGVDIVPQAMQASMKLAPSTAPTSTQQPDLIDVISTSEQKHYIWIELLRSSGMVPTLQQAGPYTVLAPTDGAFEKLPPGVIDRLLLPSHRPALLALVKYHLLAGRVDPKDLQQTNGQVPTLAGGSLVIRGIDDKVMINDANVIRSDSAAINGTVYWIDTVLLPG
jgi:uncharacterized surface protein with fasciclin (FAS1) repeats